MKAAALTLSQYANLEAIPKNWQEWHSSIRRARGLSESLFSAWDEAVLFRRLATLRLDVPVFNSIDELRWTGPRVDFNAVCGQLRLPELARRAKAAEAQIEKSS